MECKKIVILASLPEEIDVFNRVVDNYRWDNKEVILHTAGVGKSSAASVTQKMISLHKPDIILYTGVAGALSKDINIGDIGVVTAAVDSEMDARAFNPRLKLGQFPFTNQRIFKTDEKLARLALEHPLNVKTFPAFVATSSQFMDAQRKERFVSEILPLLKDNINGVEMAPNLIDMESTGFLTAVLQNNIPALIIRSVSNTMEGDAPKDLMKFLWERVGEYLNLVAYIVTNIHKV